jgi:glucose-1-phosphate thymidylyltransferase
MGGTTGRRVTAIIPAAGRATRLGSTISGSKEVVDLGGRPVISHLLERLATASVDRVLIALREGKWDIPATLVGDTLHGLAPAYVIVGDTPSPAHSIAPALRFAADDVVTLAFPDVIFEPRNAMARMLDRLEYERAEIVLGVFPSSLPERVDMVEIDLDGRVTDIVIKQPDRGLRYCWSLAAWSPAFTTYLLDRLPADAELAAITGEFQIGNVIRAAIADGMPATSVVFDVGGILDVGTPEDLQRARQLLSPTIAAELPA